MVIKMINLKSRLNSFYRFMRYGERETCVEFESKIVECQYVLTSNVYNCENCIFMPNCFSINNSKLLRYLKRNDMYKDGNVGEMDDLNSYPAETQIEIEKWRVK